MNQACAAQCPWHLRPCHNNRYLIVLYFSVDISMTKIAFLMDPIETVAIKKDSTLAMIRAAQVRGMEPYYCRQEDLVITETRVCAYLRPLSIVEHFAEALDPASVNNGDDPWFTLGSAELLPLSNMDIVMMRKDPPFDMEYIYTTYLLERAETEGVRVVNRPGSLRDCNEKLFATAVAS